ncbi:hypothetical protein OESDEN_14909 [Oesophagostomum dentatum]|uniref:Uncharacterized protein n=1 Tax=Oesophagostomum dentatum TaxID=61180 RepID=A0A0B1SJ53_OESDE|nr:hypothetical protein OESDEN_14909 [Oesophagostomum dentatum]
MHQKATLKMLSTRIRCKTRQLFNFNIFQDLLQNQRLPLGKWPSSKSIGLFLAAHSSSIRQPFHRCRRCEYVGYTV